MSKRVSPGWWSLPVSYEMLPRDHKLAGFIFSLDDFLLVGRKWRKNVLSWERKWNPSKMLVKHICPAWPCNLRVSWAHPFGKPEGLQRRASPYLVCSILKILRETKLLEDQFLNEISHGMRKSLAKEIPSCGPRLEHMWTLRFLCSVPALSA